MRGRQLLRKGPPDPGARPGDVTTIKVTYYDVVGVDGALAPFETFTLRRPRRD